MKTYISILVILFTCIHAKAQSMIVPFKQGKISYRVDTISRLESHPSTFIISQFEVIMKNDLVRFDIIKKDLYDSTKIIHFTEIRNKNGIYSMLAMKDTSSNMTMYRTFDEDKIENNLLSNQVELKTVQKEIKDTVWLHIPAKSVLLANIKTKNEPAIITSAIQIPINLFFKTFFQIISTPLQFLESDGGWILKFTAVKISSQTITDKLFEVKTENKTLTPEELINNIRKN